MPVIQSLLSEDKQGNPLPLLATAWTVSPDKKSVTLTLRKGVKFHDGSDFNAQAAMFNLDAVMEAKVGGTELWDSIRAIDDYTVQINFKNFQNSFFETLCGTAGMMVSQKSYQSNGIEWCRWNPVGTGPFKFQSFQRDVNLKFVKNENYWDTGKPYLDGIEYHYLADETVGTLAMQAGGVDLMDIGNAKLVADLQKSGFVITYNVDATDTLHFDSANSDSPFANKLVRQAANYAVDKEAIAKALGFGFYAPAFQPAVPTNMGYIPNLEVLKYDPNKARQLLKEAGYETGFKTQVIAGTDANKDFLASVQNYFKSVGIDLQLNILDIPTYRGYMSGGWKGMIRGPVNSFPNFNRGLYNGYLAQPPSFKSVMHPAGFDEAIMAAITSPEVDPAKTAVVVKIIVGEALNLPVYSYAVGIAATKKVNDHNFCQMGYQLWTPQNVWLSK